MRRISICLAFCSLCWCFLSDSARAEVLYARYLDATWTLILKEETGELFCYGADLGEWGKEDVRQVDRRVYKLWVKGTKFGPFLVYSKGIEYRWVLLDPYQGTRRSGGVLFYMAPETGFVEWVAITPVSHGVFVKVAFDVGEFSQYFMDRWGRMKVIKKGKL